MEISTAVLGATAAKYLASRSTQIILRLGSDHFTRKDLARVGCYAFLAAANLDRLLNDDKEPLAIKNARDLYDTVSPRDLCLPRLGAISLAVLGAAFEARKIGGSRPLANWYDAHLKDADRVTFQSLKARPREDAEGAPRRRRKATRRAASMRLVRAS